MHQFAEAAKAVKQVAEFLGRETSFSVVEKTLNSTFDDEDFGNRPLSFISDDLVPALIKKTSSPKLPLNKLE
jgi:hypothetical protein